MNRNVYNSLTELIDCDTESRIFFESLSASVQKQLLSENDAKSLSELQMRAAELKNEKNAGDNRWYSTGLRYEPDERERRDGPGGEEGQ